MSSNTEEVVVNVTIYTHTQTNNSHTDSHSTVIQLCTLVSMSSLLSGISGDSLPVSLTHTNENKLGSWVGQWLVRLYGNCDNWGALLLLGG